MSSERGQAVEVALEVAVAVGKLPEVEDDEPGAELARDPAVERRSGRGRARRRTGSRPSRLSAWAVTNRQAAEVVDDALVPGSVDRRSSSTGGMCSRIRRWSVKSGLRVTDPVESSGLTRRRRDRDQARRVAGEQVDAREAGPLAVRLEQLGRLPALDAAAAHRGEQLHQTEVSLEAALETAEALEADDAERPRAEAALAEEPVGDRRRSAAPSAARARPSASAAARVAPRRAWRPSLRSSAGEKRARSAVVGGMLSPSRRLGRRADDPPLHRARLARQDQLAAERAEQRLGDGRRAAPAGARAAAGPSAPSSGSRWKRRTNGVWSSSIPRQKRSWSSASSPVARRQTTPSGRCQATARPAGTIGVQDPVAERAGRIDARSGREGERIGPARAQVGGDHEGRA